VADRVVPPLPPDLVDALAHALARAIVQAVRRDAARLASDTVDNEPHTVAEAGGTR